MSALSTVSLKRATCYQAIDTPCHCSDNPFALSVWIGKGEIVGPVPTSLDRACLFVTDDCSNVKWATGLEIGPTCEDRECNFPNTDTSAGEVNSRAQFSHLGKKRGQACGVLQEGEESES